MTLRTTSRIALVLGALSLVAMLIAGMALQDIYHGEPDLTLEWRALQVSSLLILAFHAFALMAVWKGAGFPLGRQG
jgi:hypothetical protein